ncbi:MAG: DUF3822 family protein [Phycisphaerales bacterium]|nr:DUF3822 family protein [Phycisphaerales bacterium]
MATITKIFDSRILIDHSFEQECCVVIEHNHIVVLLKNKSRSIHSIEIFEFTHNQMIDWEDLLNNCLNDSAILKDRGFHEVTFYLQTVEMLLMPDAFFNEKSVPHHFNVSYGEKPHRTIRIRKLTINKEGLTYAYRYPVAIHHWITTNITKPVIESFSSSQLYKLEHAPTNQHSFVDIKVLFKEIMLLVVMQNRIVLLQSYPYQSMDDILYRILLITNTLSLSTKELNLYISGMINTESVFFELCMEKFKTVELAAVESDWITDNLRLNMPLHYLYPYFNLML